MAHTTSNLISRVQRRIRDTSYSSSEIKEYLNDTLNDIYNEYRLKFMKTNVTYTVTIGNSDITAGANLPANHVQTIKLIDTSDGQERQIEHIFESDLDELYPDHGDQTRYANGQPRYWYDDGDTIRLHPAPAAAYVLKLRYYKRPTLLVLDADEPEVPSEFEEILVMGASYRVLQVKDNYDQAGILENKYQELLQKLAVRYSRDTVGGVQLMPVNKAMNGRRQVDSWHRRG